MDQKGTEIYEAGYKAGFRAALASISTHLQIMRSQKNHAAKSAESTSSGDSVSRNDEIGSVQTDSDSDFEDTVVEPKLQVEIKYPRRHRRASVTTAKSSKSTIAAVLIGQPSPVVQPSPPQIKHAQWIQVMEKTGRGVGVTKGMYLDGEVSINGHYAATKLRVPPCGRCARHQKHNCLILDLEKEKNMVSRICNNCIRGGQGCID